MKSKGQNRAKELFKIKLKGKWLSFIDTLPTNHWPCCAAPPACENSMGYQGQESHLYFSNRRCIKCKTGSYFIFATKKKTLFIFCLVI